MSTEAESSRNVSVSMGEGPPDEALLRWKAEIVSHPLYEQLLASHVSCLRIATPMDRLHTIDSQLARCQHVVSKYSVFLRNANNPPLLDEQRKELDHFLSQYVLLLCTFKDQLQYHVRVHAMDAVMACFEIEKSFMSLTGISLAEAVGSTVSDDDEDDYMGNDSVPLEGDFDDHGAFGFGPLVPTDNERSLIEKVRQELKQDLKQGYRSKISDVREEILRKRRAGKLPGDTTCRLKEWWQSHAKWPYPTEDEKARLVEETGLQLKQINNWFINQRKRNWHSNPSAAAAVSNSSKRKREV